MTSAAVRFELLSTVHTSPVSCPLWCVCALRSSHLDAISRNQRRLVRPGDAGRAKGGQRFHQRAERRRVCDVQLRQTAHAVWQLREGRGERWDPRRAAKNLEREENGSAILGCLNVAKVASLQVFTQKSPKAPSLTSLLWRKRYHSGGCLVQMFVVFGGKHSCVVTDRASGFCCSTTWSLSPSCWTNRDRP